MAVIRVYPVEGRLVRHPQTKLPIDAEGIEVDDADPFWFRRIDSGDITVTPPASSAAPAKRAALNSVPTEEQGR
jgi:hypothetical protein